MKSESLQLEKEQVIHQKHDELTLLYAISRLFERAGFYGLRAIIMLYMFGETLNMNDVKAINVYSVFIGSIIFSQIIGAILGDLFIGSKNAVILGGILQAIGSFCLCIPSTTEFYYGLIIIVIGGGLYTPNILSLYGKSYLTKTNLLDSAFSILYVATNLGAFFGVLLIGFVGHKFGLTKGFAIAGIFFIFSIIFPLVLKERKI